MMQYEREGVIITDTRQEGVTIADEISARFGKKKGAWPFRSLDVPNIPTPDLRFESIKYLVLSSDRTHLLAAARDGDILYFIRNDKVVFSGHFLSIIRVMDEVSDFSNIIFRTVDQNEKADLRHLNKDGNIQVILDDQDQINIINPTTWDSGLLAVGRKDQTLTFVSVTLDGSIAKQFSVQGAGNLEQIRYDSISKDFSSIVWISKDLPRDEDHQVKTYSLYLNDKLIDTRVLYHEFSEDFSQSLVVRPSEEWGSVEIVLDGKIVENSPLRLCGDNRYSRSPIRASGDLTWAAVGLTDGTQKWLYCITPKWHGLLSDHAFDREQRWEFEVDEDGIECTGKRNGIKRTFRVQMDNQGKPQVTEEAA
jgi:hypothetical protein